MIITYQGLEHFKIQHGDIVVGINPPSKNSKFKSAKYGADIAISTLNHADMNGASELSYGDREPFVISGPGEYEVKGITIKALSSVSHYGGDERINSICMINMENMNICFLGALDSKELKNEIEEQIDDVDILFVPVGADGVLAPADAYKLAVKLEPRLIIPMHYHLENKKMLTIFLKEAGEQKTEELEKLTLKKKDLDGKEGDVIVLKSV